MAKKIDPFLWQFAGVSSSGGTPDPIPNSEVKSTSGDGIAEATLWESSTTPALFYNPVTYVAGFFLIISYWDFSVYH